MSRSQRKKMNMAAAALSTAAVLAFAVSLPARSADRYDRYHGPAELVSAMKELASAHPGLVRIHSLEKSPGGRDLIVVEIGPETAVEKKESPAVFVAANMEGTVPIASEAALFLARAIIARPDARSERTWYILPCGNPDAAARFFVRPLLRDPRNARPYNDDMDDRTDEDGPEDLNGDGFITMMRVKDPQGEWLPVPEEPRLMKRADWSKGEKGIYRLYTEGLDNDGDGLINEDGPGGVNVGVNFPHLFHSFARDGGAWPGSEKESFAVMEFIDRHREIGLALTFGGADFCLTPPRGGRRSGTDLKNIKVPANLAGYIGADPDRTYAMEEINELLRPLFPPGQEIDNSMISGFLGLGAMVNPLDEDLKFYGELSGKYREFLKKNKMDGKRLEPPSDKDGSFELWAYYQLGIPSFAMNLWTLPEPEAKVTSGTLGPDKLEKMTGDEIAALGEDKISGLLKAAGAPEELTAAKVIQELKSGQRGPKDLASMMREMGGKSGEAGAVSSGEKALLAFSDGELQGRGFVEWKPFKHPTLGEVEIGGAVPFVDSTPPAAMIGTLLEGRVPWAFELAARMPRIRISRAESKAIGKGLFEIKVSVENAGGLPYPTAMGQKDRRIPPVIMSIGGQGFEIVDGRKRAFVQSLKPLEEKTITWIVRAEKPGRLNIAAETQTAGRDSRSIDLEGAK